MSGVSDSCDTAYHVPRSYTTQAGAPQQPASHFVLDTFTAPLLAECVPIPLILKHVSIRAEPLTDGVIVDEPDTVAVSERVGDNVGVHVLVLVPVCELLRVGVIVSP